MVNFYLLPIEQVGIYRGPKYLKWKFGEGLTGSWSLKDFGNQTDVGLVAYDGVINQPDVLELSNVWSIKQRDTISIYFTNVGIENSWITRTPDWREGLHRIAGLALAHQGKQDNPDKWLGRPIYCGPVGLNPIDWQAFEEEQAAKVQQKVKELQVRDDFDRKSPQWLDILKLIIENPLALPFLALPATDTFTAASDQALTTYSANWTYNNGTFTVVASTDTAIPATSGDNMARWTADSFSADQYSQCTIAVAGDNDSGVAVRCGASGLNGYSWSANFNNSYLAKYVSGTWTQLGSNGAAVVNGDTLRLEVSSTTLTPKKNGSTLNPPGPQTDNSHGSGEAGIYGYVGTNAESTIDNWEGGNIGGAATTNPWYAYAQQ